MSKKLYYVIPFVAIPVIMLLIERFVTPLNIVAMFAFYSGLISLLLFSAIIGFLSPSKKTFDYLLTFLVPLALFCTMFVCGFLDKTDLETRFHLYKAVKTAFQPVILQLYLAMPVTTFVASFKGFKNVENVVSNKLNSQKRAILKKIVLSTIAVVYNIATVIWYYIAVKNYIFVFKTLSGFGIIGVSDWKASMSIFLKLDYIWYLLLSILFLALNTVIAVMLTRRAFGKVLTKKTKLLLCILLAITLVFYILVPFYKYFWALYAVFKRIQLISVFGVVYFVILALAFAISVYAIKKKKIVGDDAHIIPQE
jgi:hypothetical protein